VIVLPGKQKIGGKEAKGEECLPAQPQDVVEVEQRLKLSARLSVLTT
jgi:hypothetical protein